MSVLRAELLLDHAVAGADALFGVEVAGGVLGRLIGEGEGRRVEEVEVGEEGRRAEGAVGVVASKVVRDGEVFRTIGRHVAERGARRGEVVAVVAELLLAAIARAELQAGPVVTLTQREQEVNASIAVSIAGEALELLDPSERVRGRLYGGGVHRIELRILLVRVVRLNGHVA
ncbi:MAG: hypothetical protein MUD17_00695, partial [Gemmatimonadaceae bacterium]|nr:hypothetical protein [Gemmatimonadaceae bacterium]